MKTEEINDNEVVQGVREAELGDVFSKVLTMLQPLSPHQRTRVLDAAKIFYPAEICERLEGRDGR